MKVPTTENKVSFLVMDILRLEDGKYMERWARADIAWLLGQLKAY